VADPREGRREERRGTRDDEEAIMEPLYPSAWTPDVVMLSMGLLVARLVLGLAMAAHGAQKIFGWFGGLGLAGTAGFLDQVGFRPGRLFAAVAAFAEVFSGVLMALGLLGPVGPALMISVMIVAMGAVHWSNGFFAMNDGVEVPVLYAVGATALALTGPGIFSVDAVFGLEWLWMPRIAWATLAVGVVGGVANLAIRRRPVRQLAAEQ
jgi:putative oxidoreductase